MLTADARILAAEVYEAVLTWAVRTMEADLAAARLIDPSVEAPRALRGYRLRPLAGGSAESIRQATAEMINQVNAWHAGRPGARSEVPVVLSREVAVLSLDPAAVGRDIARASSTHVRVDVTRSDGTLDQVWIGLDGAEYRFDPERVRPNGDGAVWVYDPSTSRSRYFGSAVADRNGVLSPAQRAEADAYRLTYREMGRLYSAAAAGGQTFEQAFSAEIDARGGRLAAIDPALPGLLTRAFDANAAVTPAVPEPTAGAQAAASDGLDAPHGLDEMGLRPIHVPATGDGVVHVLGAVAAAELSVVRQDRPATPTEVRAHLADALTADLSRAPGERSLWPILDGQIPRLQEPAPAPTAGPSSGGQALTDDQRRAIVSALTAPDGSERRGELTLAAAAVVFGLHITLLRPDGVSVEFGPSTGRRVVTVRLPQAGPHTGVWAATEPVTASSPVSPPLEPVVRPSVPPAAAAGTGLDAAEDPQPAANLGLDPFGGR